jgi:hypothetical protein
MSIKPLQGRADMLGLVGGSMNHDSNHPVYNFLFEVCQAKIARPWLSIQLYAKNSLRPETKQHTVLPLQAADAADYSKGVERPAALLLPTSTDAV